MFHLKIKNFYRRKMIIIEIKFVVEHCAIKSFLKPDIQYLFIKFPQSLTSMSKNLRLQLFVNLVRTLNRLSALKVNIKRFAYIHKNTNKNKIILNLQVFAIN